MSEIRAEIAVGTLEPYTIEDITDFLVRTSGFSREKVLEIQAKTDREWRGKYGATAEEMLEQKRNRTGNE